MQTALAALLASAVHGHELGVLKVYLEAIDSGSYELRTQLNGLRPEYFPTPILPDDCSAAVEIDGNWIVHHISCVRDGLAPTDVITLPWQREGALVFARWQNGMQANHFFTRGPEGIEIHLQLINAPGSTGWRTAVKYIQLGITHILMGVDHLLFVAGLLLLVSGPWMLVKTITSFTIAHSITLAMAVLGIFWLDTSIVDMLIALSIVFVAVEILYAQAGRTGISQKKPWAMAFLFGLLHGMGFAGALKALDLPTSDLPPALLSFNIGVELGHLLFIAVIYLTVWSTVQLRIRIPARSRIASAYAIGSLAAFWLIGRLIVLVASWTPQAP